VLLAFDARVDDLHAVDVDHIGESEPITLAPVAAVATEHHVVDVVLQLGPDGDRQQVV
jgi:anti-sigma factor RsiW